MIGAGKLMKEAKKMQKELESVQKRLDDLILNVTSGGGAIEVSINASGQFLGFSIKNLDILKEDSKLLEELILTAIQEASIKAAEAKGSAMDQVTSGFRVPGLL